MKILLISGHGDGDPGAIGNGCQEANLTIEMVNGIAPILRQYAIVDVYPTNRNAFKDIQKGQLQVNFANYDYVLEIHFNAGGGTGTEIYVTTKERSTKVEQAIMNGLQSFYKVRGVKVTDFLVIKTAKNKGVSSALLETCFIDSASDINVYQSRKQDIFYAVALGVVEGFGIKQTNTANSTIVTKPDSQLHTVASEAIENGMSVATKDTITKGFWISKYTTSYGGASYGVKIPDKILQATTKYTCQQIKFNQGEYWVLAKEIQSWIRISECLVK